MVDSLKNESNEIGRIIQSYFMVGLRENKIIKYHDEENELDFLQKIDILITEDKIKVPIYKPKLNEKWQAINKNTWLRCEYNNFYSKPITGLKIIECQIQENFLVII
jgi:hypothetical protein